MRDRKAVRIPAPAGRAQFEGTAPVVVVVGGGIAGLSAATLLAERGAQVVLCERENYLGGRVGGWSTRLADGSDATMTRGFHAFFRQYYNLRALLERVDPAGRALVAVPDYPLQHASGHRDGFAHLPKTVPWNVLAFLRSSPTFRWRDLPDVNARAALSLLDVSVPRVYEELDGIDAATYLERIRFPEAAHALAFEVFSRSFFAHPTRMSAAELAVMFHIYFLGSSEGLLFDVAADPFPHGLWEPLRRHLALLGATVCTGTEVRSVLPGEDKRFSVTIGGGAIEADAVVLAADVPGLRSLVGDSPALGDAAWREKVGGLRTAPRFLVSRYWLDTPVDADRPGFLGTGGHDLLDNISVLNHYEHEARAWAARTGGSVVELHGYALPSDVDEQDARARLWAQLTEVYPETKRAGVVDERHELREDCPLFPAGGYAGRPGVTTPDDFLVVAGDLVRIDLPVALMERAATTGFAAANHLLSRWGVAGTDLWTVPAEGRAPLLRAAARRWRTL
ncbi:FAD-dependent oxidoreductase [Lentzea flaviverrucosa]|uniref:Isorenieratene synthase n=1 Tax=Lentzea flaviverrucosa TaxID=200379 RepID=A0A1H8ZXG4_9PSEU|nr:FAD-dependent oxidoreductase [Lentzea flaviverrucosa]RDI32223.1 isorenieratene synthase [Lentzea flaviverrucosa]SEP69064.1 isorenieratene synthase [Lentzea flaviverrucosa]